MTRLRPNNLNGFQDPSAQIFITEDATGSAATTTPQA